MLFFYFSLVYNGLSDSILWTTDYKDIRSDHAELTDRGRYFYWTIAELQTLSLVLVIAS